MAAKDQPPPSGLSAAAVAAQPGILVESLHRMVGPIRNRGLGGPFVDEARLLDWERRAEAVVRELPPADLKSVYAHYATRRGRTSGEDEALGVVRRSLRRGFAEHSL